MLLPLHMNALAMIPTFFTWNVNIGLCLPTARTLIHRRLSTRFEVLLINRINKRVGLRKIRNFQLLRETLPDRLASGIRRSEGVP
jgi:hypothetical protein